MAFTSKSGQSVEHTRHRIFFDFSVREDILKHFTYIGLISDCILQGYSR